MAASHSYSSFLQPNNKLVWEEAVRITMDMIENEWKNEEEIIYDHVNEMTLQIALLIIGSAGELFHTPEPFRALHSLLH